MPTSSDPPTGRQRLGDFEILREVGRSGMGVVLYEARQVSLNRKVALKVLTAGLGVTSRAVERFRREAEVVARLHHTHIVPVYATGEQDGIHFYAMGLIEGPSLDQVLKRMRASPNRSPAATPGSPSPPELAEAAPYVTGQGGMNPASSLRSSSLVSGPVYFDTVARMIAEVADALEHAHKNGVIHCDIKPSNLLLDAHGIVWVTDFGLAKATDVDDLTHTADIIGTVRYMAPERFRGRCDARSDVYALGLSLYEMLALRPAFQGVDPHDLIRRIAHKEPPRLRRLDPAIPRDLETIVYKAIEKDPAHRYATAGLMAADLRNYVNRFAISARRAGPLARLRKWVYRTPAWQPESLVRCWRSAWRPGSPTGPTSSISGG